MRTAGPILALAGVVRGRLRVWALNQGTTLVVPSKLLEKDGGFSPCMTQNLNEYGRQAARRGQRDRVRTCADTQERRLPRIQAPEVRPYTSPGQRTEPKAGPTAWVKSS
jgi:hypothetical protein